MGLITGLFQMAVDVVTLPVAAVMDVATLGHLDATRKVAKKLVEDTEDTLTGGDGSIL